MKTLIFIFASIVVIATNGVALAQTEAENAFYSSNVISVQELPKVKGLVRLVDHANSKIKIKHEEIPNLDMPPMTMTFAANDPQMLVGLANGDKVLFTADMVNNELTVMWIEKQP